MVAEQVADHQHQAALVGELDEALGRGGVLSERLLDEAVLARLERPLGELGVGRDRGGDRDRVEVVVGEQVVEVGREPGLG